MKMEKHEQKENPGLAAMYFYKFSFYYLFFDNSDHVYSKTQSRSKTLWACINSGVDQEPQWLLV